MNMSYKAIESRLINAINTYNTSSKKNLSAIAREFHVSSDRLRSRLLDTLSKSEIRDLHNRRLKSDQELALKLYCQHLAEADKSVRLNALKAEVNRLLLQDYNPVNFSSSINSH